MINLGTVCIETDRLVLRRFVKEDYKAMYNNWASDSEVTKFLMWPTHQSEEVSAYVIDEWIASYDRKDFYQWAIAFKEKSNNVVGAISVVDMDEDVEKVHIGYCIGRKWWHKGITSEALKGVMDFLFKEVKVNRIESRHDPRNPNSGGVMRKCGMKYEGTLRSSDRNNQGICDASFYAILKSEWEMDN